MAINPGSDLLADALIAADPQKAKAAAEKLAAEAAQDGAGVASFEGVLSAVPPAGLGHMPGQTAVLSHAPVSAKSGDPYERFEAVMLQSMFESMLPEKASSVFGSGF